MLPMMTLLQHSSLLIQIRAPKNNLILQGVKQCHPEPVTAIAGTESRDPVCEQSLDCFCFALYLVLCFVIPTFFLCHSREGGNPPKTTHGSPIKLGMTSIPKSTAAPTVRIPGSRHSFLALGESTGQDDASPTQQSFGTNKSRQEVMLPLTQCQAVSS